jgi:hypothetical protein
MMPLLAQAENITVRLARLGTFTEWWHWLVLALVCGAVLAYTVWMYRRDSVELSRSLAMVLTLLRLVAFAGILFYYFKLEVRTERQITQNSRAIVLVDTSQSMAIRDANSASGTGLRRIDEAVAAVGNSKLLEELRTDHDVVVMRFDQDERPVEIASLSKFGVGGTVDDAFAVSPQVLQRARLLAAIGAGFLAAGLFAAAVHFAFGRNVTRPEERTAWSLLVSMVALIASVIVLATASLLNPHLPLETIAGLSSELPQPKQPSETSSNETPNVDWAEQLKPQGLETRLVDNLRTVIAGERGGTAAGIVVVTDGNNNAGGDPSAAVHAARDAAIPIFPVGLGSDVLPVNVRVVDVEAPQRAYLGDKFTVTGHLLLTGVKKTSIALELASAPASSKEEKPLEILEEERTVEASEGQLVTVRFEVEPEKDQVGRREYRLRAKPIDRETEADDNLRTAKVDVVDRKDRVLLLAGGPMREFIFLRNQLFRDETHATHVTVLLQSARPGIAQEAHEILYEFPKTADALFEYDAIVAFDPDWNALDELQIELLERFVAEKAGGLIVVAGPVFTPQWSASRDAGKLRTIKKLYPVQFYGPAASSSALSRFGSTTAWPIEFTREGREASFLWLGNDSITSERAWNSFPGIYGYFAVKDPKAGATVYARFADPDARFDDQFPIYMAGHFYGSGRVFYLGSGEMWRTREVDEALFEEFYTKLIRWVAEGRLLRDSTRGLLLLDKERCYVGDRVTIRATLEDDQHRPLSLPEVQANLVTPKGLRVPLTLRRVTDADREGIYSEQFTAAQEGDYRVELASPGFAEELLVREVRSRIPDSELRNSKRNDALLGELAERTGGTYFVGADSVVPTDEASPLANKLEPKDQTRIETGMPDKKFEERLMGWLIALIVGVLSCEWLIRRLNKLA